MSDIDVSLMYVAVRKTVLLITGLAEELVLAAYQNVANPSKLDNVGRVITPYLSIVEIPVAQSDGYPDVNNWVEDAPASVAGTQQSKDDFEATFEIHQTGGRGEILQKIKAALSLETIIQFMVTESIVSRRYGATIPLYSINDKRWGPDCMAEFIFAGSYRLSQASNKVTDVTYTFNTN